MTKPSIRIRQIYHEKRQWEGGNKNGDMLQAVIAYLDELAEDKPNGKEGNRTWMDINAQPPTQPHSKGLKE